MYSRFINQFNNISLFLLGSLLIFILCPLILFKRSGRYTMETFFENLINMTLLLIVAGYILVLTKLFEVLAIAALLIILAFRRYLTEHSIGKWSDFLHLLNVRMYEITDGIIHPNDKIKTWLRKKLESIRRYVLNRTKKVTLLLEDIALFTVIAYSAYLRFYDATINAAPALSDAYTTLSWMKHIDARELFFTGGGEVYPRGFHIVLATLNKFSAIDPLYVLRYSGPLAAVLIVLGIYYSVSRLTESRISGILASAVYGVLGQWLPMAWERHASTNSQEFAFIFVIPVLYLFYKYFQNPIKDNLKPALMGLIVVGLIHQYALALTGLGMGMLIAAALFTNAKRHFKTAAITCASGILAVIISIIPIGLGYLMGFKPLETSMDYLVSTAEISFPQLLQIETRDRLVLAAAAALIILILIRIKQFKKLLPEMFIVLLGAGAFSFYFFGGAVTQSVVVSSRSGELWALAIPVCIGGGWHAVEQMFHLEIIKKAMGLIVCFVFLCYIILYIKPLPIIPYKMHHNVNIEQYFRISSTFRPKSWWLVSPQYEDYAIVLGSGFLVYADEFINMFNPKTDKLTRKGSDKPDQGLPEDIFIYFEKDIFKVSEDNGIYGILKPDYERREKLKEDLRGWLEKYQASHDNISVYFEDDNLKVFRIHIPMSREEEVSRIWGIEDVREGAS